MQLKTQQPQWIDPETQRQSPFLEVTGAEFRETIPLTSWRFGVVVNLYLIGNQAILMNDWLNVSREVGDCLSDLDTMNATFDGLMIAILKEDILTTDWLANFLRYHPSAGVNEYEF